MALVHGRNHQRIEEHLERLRKRDLVLARIRNSLPFIPDKLHVTLVCKMKPDEPG